MFNWFYVFINSSYSVLFLTDSSSIRTGSPGEPSQVSTESIVIFFSELMIATAA
jgi:hypothetical protein